ncbi:MAG TPA: septal ring lytic transglycosylase RlpA family protein [Rhodanobacteraceae bacterium]
MSLPWRLALVAATSALLAACGTHNVKAGKRHVTGSAGSGASGAAAASASGVHDDILLPQDERYAHKHDGGPGRPAVDVDKLPEPVPKVEPRSRYGNKSPYTVNGKTYHVLRSAKGYVARGLASWYGNKFDGYLTSSMERYDMYKFSAASKVLPLPTYARVTNLSNGKSVIVRVNDRGPFVKDRIIDLSYAAAVRIGVWPKGTAKVEVQAIDPTHPGELPPASAVGHSAVADNSGFWLQVGSFSDDANARDAVARLRDAHLGPVHVSRVTVGGRSFMRVRLGPLADAADVKRVSAAARALGLPVSPVKVD